MSVSLVILASGKSTRFGFANKLLLEIAPSLTILECAIRNAVRYMVAEELVVTVSEEVEEKAATYLKKSRIDGITVQGGIERADSVRNALNLCTKDYVLIHDAARPFASEALYGRVKGALKPDRCVVPVVPVADTLYKVDERGSVYGTAQRECLTAVQTPQGFPLNLLRDVHERACCDKLLPGDDGSLFLHYGLNVVIVEGERANFKITYPTDLEIARVIAIKAGIMEAMRIGN